MSRRREKIEEKGKNKRPIYYYLPGKPYTNQVRPRAWHKTYFKALRQ
jgi:hypothetical protein